MAVFQRWSAALLLTLISHAAAGAAASSLAMLEERAGAEGVVPVIVQLKAAEPEKVADPVSRRARQAGIADAQAGLLTRLRRYDDPRVRRYRALPYLAMDASAEEIRQLAVDPSVASVQPDLRRRPRLAESVPRIGADVARQLGHTAQGWAVAVIDDGVHTAHPFLAGKTVAQQCFEWEGDEEAYCGDKNSAAPPPGSPLCGVCTHGTHVAGIAVGGPADGVDFTGVAPEAGLVAVATDLYDSSIFLGLDYVIGLHDSGEVKLAAVNFSWGGLAYYTDTCDTQLLASGYVPWVEALVSRGIAVVAAAGNERALSDEEAASWGLSGDHRRGIIDPACLSKVVAVGAVADEDRIAFYSNHNTLIDVLAPGGPITSSVRDGYADASGTSMATPHVAGAFAVLRAAYPDASVSDLLAVLKSSGETVSVDENGATLAPKPRIRIDRALDTALPADEGGGGGGGGGSGPLWLLVLLAALAVRGRRGLLWGGLLGLTACAAPSSGPPDCPQQAEGDREALIAQATAGPVMVIVGLRLPHRPGGELDAAARGTQRQVIRASQEQVLKELGKGGVRVIEQYEHVPSLALEVDRSALERLFCLPDVASVYPDRQRYLR